jgi:isopentenyl-diphosphate delta-isomerase
MADELIDIFDDSNNPLNRIELKSKAHAEGLRHRAAHIWIYNSKGEILLQLRSKDSWFPDVWDISASGHIGAGESAIIGALRELSEEVGIFAEPEDLEFIRIKRQDACYGSVIDNEFNYIYLFNFEGEIKDLALQQEEVADARFILLEELEKELKESLEIFFPRKSYWAEIVVEIRKRLA